MSRLNRFMAFIGLFILDVLYSSIVISLLKLTGIDFSSLSVLNKSFILITIDISLMLIIYLIYRRDLNSEFIKYIKNFFNLFKFGLKFWILGLIIMFTSNFIIGLFGPDIANNEAAVQESLIKMPVYMAFSSCFFAPFVEEIIFRKCLKGAFKWDIVFIIFSGLLFGLVHNISSIGSMQMLYIIPYGAFGAIFAYMYTKTKNIFVPMTFHFIHNTVLVIFSLLSVGVI